MIRAALALAVLGLGACSRRQPAASSDSAFAAMQQRGRAVMGVDQSTSTHHFDELPDGGRIVLQRDDRTDTAGVRAIRDHVRAVHEFLAFQRGAHRAGGQHMPGMHMP